MRRILNASDRDFQSARLTWMAGSVAPFESAWSVFARVMATNFLTWNELRQLVSHSAATEKAGGEFISAQSIALDRYAALLGEHRTVLETGFLDTLGFPASLLGTRSIRHCPACARAGYHCTLFALGSLTHCPWHRIPLASGCLECATTVRTMRPRDLSQTVTCPACGTRIIDPAYRIAGVTDPDLRRAAEICCNEIVAWWRSVCDRERVANELIGDALGAGGFREALNLGALQWGAACGLALPPECWLTNRGAAPANIFRWTGSRRSPVDDLDVERLTIRRYRSVRRQIFRKFVRPHRRCLSILTSAKRADVYCLDREQACAVCLAFIAWRRAIEQNIDAVEQTLRKMRETNAAFPHSRGFQSGAVHPTSCWAVLPATFPERDANRPVRRWKLRMPTLGGLAPSAELVPRILYAEFLRIWMGLEVQDIGSNLKVIVNPLRGSDLLLPVAQISGESLEVATVPGWAVVVPDGHELARQSWERCTQRELHRWSMFDAKSKFNADAFEKFNWNSCVPIDLLFMLHYRERRGAGAFKYVFP